MITIPDSDTLYSDYIIGDVTGDVDSGWSVGFKEGLCCFIGPTSPVVPSPGMTLRMYGQRFGTIRGQVLDGKVVFYRSPGEQERREAEQHAQRQRDKQERFENSRDTLDAQYEALPDAFKKRIDWFRSQTANWRVEFEAYELMCCCDAVKIADALKTRNSIENFSQADWEDQKKAVPDLDDGHSGNSFGMACRLAWVYVEEPDMLWKWHGAMCPLVGCEEYGCYAAYRDKEPQP